MDNWDPDPPEKETNWVPWVLYPLLVAIIVFVLIEFANSIPST